MNELAPYRRKIQVKGIEKLSRNEKLGYLKNQVLEYVQDIFTYIDVPSIPDIQVSAIDGFENDDDIKNAQGKVVVTCSVASLNGIDVYFDIPIPIFRGEMHYPSVLMHQNQIKVFSPKVIEAAVNQYNTNVKTYMNPYSDPSKQKSISLPVVRENMFSDTNGTTPLEDWIPQNII